MPQIQGSTADLSFGEVETTPAEQELGEAQRRRAEALARYSAGLTAESRDEGQEALEHFRALIHADPSRADLAMTAAGLAERYGEDGEAEALLESVVAANPDQAAPRLRLLEFLDAYRADQASRQRADQLMRETLERFPDQAEVRATLALRQLTLGRRGAAQRTLEAVFEGTPADHLASDWMSLAGAAQEVWPLGDPEQVEVHRTKVNRFFEQALDAAQREGNADTRLKVAQFYLLSNQLQRAQTVCEALVRDVEDLTARKILYRLYDSQGRAEQALETLRQVVKQDPSDVSQRRLLAEVLEERQAYPEAAAELEQAVQIGGGSVEDYEKLGNLWLGLRQPDRALTLLQRASRLYPELPGFHAQMALAHSANGDLPKSISSFESADQLVRDLGMQAFNHRFYFRYGATLERAGKFERAARQLEKSIRMTPEEEVGDAANTMNYLGYMWLELGRNLDKGGELIEKANELVPNSPAYIDSLGWFYFKKGRYQDALRELRRAEDLLNELQPEDAEIIEHIALVQEALGRDREALRTMRRARDLETPDETVAKRIEDALDRMKGKMEGGASAEEERPPPLEDESGEGGPDPL